MNHTLDKTFIGAMIILILGIILLMFVPTHAWAGEDRKESGFSGKLLESETTQPQVNPRTDNVEACTNTLSGYLTIHGPILAPYARTFAEEAYDNRLDCGLVAAIAGTESGYGKAIAAPHNGWGWCGGRTCAFASWKEGIRTVSRTLNEKYCKKWKACNDPYKIGRYYAEDPKWAAKVIIHINQMKRFAQANKQEILKPDI